MAGIKIWYPCLGTTHNIWLHCAIIRLRDEYVINDEVLRRIQSDIDHAEARLNVRRGE
jgi:hypothetical protein